MLLLVASFVFLIILSGCADNRAFPPDAFPISIFAQAEDEIQDDNILPRVNIYIQATSNMLELITGENSSYPQALRAVLDNASNWGTLQYHQYVFRMDVRNQERIAMIDEFAYPLEPDQIHGRVGETRVYGVFDSEFYEFYWYVRQINRASRSFGYVREQFQHYPHHFISSVIREIHSLRNNEREISVIATNFLGNPNEGRDIYSQLTEYLVLNPNSAIATLGFYNEGLPFYVLVLGSISEVSEYSAWLRESLQEMSPQFGFYTRGSVVEHFSDNHSADVTRVYPGMRLAFDMDIHNDERNYFNQLGTRLYYTVWDRLIENSTAHFYVQVELDLLEIPPEMIDLEYSIKLMVLNRSGYMDVVPRTDEHLSVNLLPLSGGVAPIEITIDMAVFEHLDTAILPIQAALAVSLEASLSPTAFESESENHYFPHPQLIEIQNQFITDIDIERYSALAAEIFIHFIYR